MTGNKQANKYNNNGTCLIIEKIAWGDVVKVLSIRPGS